MLPLANSVGTTAGDHQVLLSSDHKLLFAVNQGSNSIAVFHVNSQTGALKPVEGSPFSSFGIAPIGLGYANGTLVVANHGVIAPFNPLGSSPPGPSDLVSFKVSPTGALTKVSSTAPDPDGLIDATVSPDGGTVVTSGLFPEVVPGQPFPTFGPQLIRSVPCRRGSARPDRRGLVPAVVHLRPGRSCPVLSSRRCCIRSRSAWRSIPDPTKKFVYVDATIAGRVAVFNYGDPASLQLVSNTMNPQAGSCWMTVSKDGRFLYNSNSASQTVSVFSISPDGSTLTLMDRVPLKSKGTTDTLAIDPSGHWLYVIGKHDDADAPRPEGAAPLPANYLDAYKINPSTGMLTEIATIQLPVPATNMPYGVDVLPKS